MLLSNLPVCVPALTQHETAQQHMNDQEKMGGPSSFYTKDGHLLEWFIIFFTHNHVQTNKTLQL
jgi:hypothetical protein